MYSPELLDLLRRQTPVFWLNPARRQDNAFVSAPGFSPADVREAEERLRRFAPVIARYFPETAQNGGIIESPLVQIDKMRARLDAGGGAAPGSLFLKMDADLAVAGSVKARGGIYEVLAHTEALALEHGILTDTRDDYLKLTTGEARSFFAGKTVQVGSTGNLGLSIGIMSAALGYRAVVHMSADAKAWKKDLLRRRGATVVEYKGDYAEAVRQGRAASAADPDSYFVDDENSGALFCGYATAGERLRRQLAAANRRVDPDHPLFVYLPCGVGGAPGGITYGLKAVFGAAAHCFFAEPTGAPCMLLGLATGKGNNICVQDVGLTGETEADGLAVGRCSALAAERVRELLSGEATVPDAALRPLIRSLWQSEALFIEPSAAAGFYALQALYESEAGKAYLQALPAAARANITHVVWATGGSLVPATERARLLAEDTPQ